MRRSVLPLIAALAVTGPATAAPQPHDPSAGGTLLVAPVDGALARRFEAPDTDWGPGHRGIDYDVAPGTPVRAAGPGTVVFAGPVAGVTAVTIAHDGDVETTYSSLAAVYVGSGTTVSTGTWIGTTARAHADAAGLHFGVKVAGGYVDPLALLAPVDLTSSVHLVPVVEWPSEHIPEMLRPAASTAGSADAPCEDVVLPGASPPPPNGNVVVALAGFGSTTGSGAGISSAPAALGYASHRTYRFSYAGTGGLRLHRPYEEDATHGDLRVAAARLGDLLAAIAQRHRGARIDLIAHSQGGLVARYFLTRLAPGWPQPLPHVEHVVTFSSPHEGAPAGRLVNVIDATRSGPALLDRLEAWAVNGGRVPNPRAVSASQLSPGSALLELVAAGDLPPGTRGLALALPDDVVVPAHLAAWDSERTATIPPLGPDGHSEIASAAGALALAYSFLRDAAAACPGPWDRWGRWWAHGIEGGYRVAGGIYQALDATLPLVWP